MRDTDILEGSREAPTLARESTKSFLGGNSDQVSIANGLSWIWIKN